MLGRILSRNAGCLRKIIFSGVALIVFINLIAPAINRHFGQYQEWSPEWLKAMAIVTPILVAIIFALPILHWGKVPLLFATASTIAMEAFWLLAYIYG